MHEVRLHREGLTLNVILAGDVEMELSQLEHMSGHLDHTARRVIHLHGVTVVEDLAASGLIGEPDRLEVCLHKGGQVDRRLVLA